MKQKILSSIVLAFIVFAAVFALFGEKIYSSFEQDVVLQNASECDLYIDSCEVVYSAGKSIKFDIDKPFKAGENLTFNVRAKGFNDDELKVKIYGINMNMGIFNYTLKKAGEDRYTGTGLLPTCMSGKMEWKIEIISPKEALGAGFKVVL
jgi:hypothetical protein